VSLGTISARDYIRVLELTEQVAAGLLVALRQAITIREAADPELSLTFSPQLIGFWGQLKEIPFMEEDVTLEPILRQLGSSIGSEKFQMY